MKKIYSFSLNEQLMDAVDRFSRKSGLSRSEVITRLLVEHINDGVDPDTVKTENIQIVKNAIIRTLFSMYKSMPEVQDFVSKFSLEVSLNHDASAILFLAENRKFYCEIKVVADSIKISARVESSSRKAYGVFEEAYNKNSSVLESQGYRRDIFQRYWNLEYRHELKEYPEEGELAILASYLLQKLLLLYTNFLIDVDYIVDKKEAACIIERTDTLKSFDDRFFHIEPPYLQAVTGAMRGKRYSLDRDRMILGRNGADINLSEQELNAEKPVVSKKHAAIAIRNDQFYIIDLNSTNGTKVNGVSINPQGGEYELKDRECFLIADIEFRLVLS